MVMGESNVMTFPEIAAIRLISLFGRSQLLNQHEAVPDWAGNAVGAKSSQPCGGSCFCQTTR
jgi:hypothetical protein